MVATYALSPIYITTCTVNYKSSVVQNFCSSLAECRENCRGFVKLQYIQYLNEPLKLVEKTFAFYGKSMKTAKVLYSGGFVVYGM